MCHDYDEEVRCGGVVGEVSEMLYSEAITMVRRQQQLQSEVGGAPGLCIEPSAVYHCGGYGDEGGNRRTALGPAVCGRSLHFGYSQGRA